MIADARADSGRTVAVVGGGVVGATTALELARRGADVTLFDADDVANGATGRAAGICYTAFAGAIDAEIAEQALETFRKRNAITPCPYVWVAREGDEANVAAIEEHVTRMQEHGLAVEVVDPADLESRWPQLRTDDLARAAVAHDAGFVDASSYTRETAQFAVAAGADLRTGTHVELGPDSRLDGRTYDAVVVAAGAHTGRFLGDAGLPIPLKAYRVQAFLSEKTIYAEQVPMLYDATGGYYFRPRNGRIALGDGVVPEEQDPEDWDDSADEWFRENCADYLETAIGESVPEHRSWAGLCTATPDGNPLVGERAPGVYVATGFQGHGFMRAPAIGERLAEAVLDGDDVDIDAFDPTRFDGDEDFEIVEGTPLHD